VDFSLTVLADMIPEGSFSTVVGDRLKLRCGTSVNVDRARMIAYCFDRPSDIGLYHQTLDV
jgi:hypothetical protein